MSLFKINANSLALINVVSANSEKELQRLIEANLKDVLDMHFIASEFATSNGRIDTLAIDSQGAPVVIEYKRNKNNNVINQALSYLKWLTSQRPEFFEMLMQKQLPGSVLNNIRLDWKHPRVICVAESFSQFDIDTVEIVPLRIELFKYRLYEGDMLSIESITLNERQNNLFDQTLQVSTETTQTAIQLMKEQSGASHLIRTLFDELREKIMSLDQFTVEKVGKRTISYRITKSFSEVLIRKDRLVIDLRPIDYIDPMGMVEKIAESYTVTLNRRITLSTPSELDYVFGIIEQSYQNVL